MVSDIRNGNFTEDELEKISRFETDADGNIQVCDLDSLYVPEFPDTYNRFYISWSGKDYSFSIKNTEDSKYCSLFLWDEASWQEELDSKLRWNTGVLRLDPTSTQADSERNGTIYYFPYATFADDGTIEYVGKKGCMYSFEQNGNLYYVCEYYDTDAPDAIPSNVSIFGISQGQHFYIFIGKPMERPSLDWIAQFGLQVYSGNTVTE